MVPIDELSIRRIRAEIREILTDGRYRTNAKLLQKQVSTINGVRRAADIIEHAIEYRTSPGLSLHNAVGTL
jgi:UDP:flavonoid glycosyltransferase YjiC (YdhE family)